jgi:hypothetical protein
MLLKNNDTNNSYEWDEFSEVTETSSFVEWSKLCFHKAERFQYPCKEAADTADTLPEAESLHPFQHPSLL